MANRIADKLKSTDVANKVLSSVLTDEVEQRLKTLEIEVVQVVSKALGHTLDDRLRPMVAEEVSKEMEKVKHQVYEQIKALSDLVKALPAVEVHVPDPKPRKKSITYDGYGRPSTIEEQ